MAKPTAAGPQSRTVIGDSVIDTTDPRCAGTPNWKRLLIPAGIFGAILLAMRYKGHV